MRLWLKRSVGLLAIYAIVLTTILSVAAPPTAGAAFDPFSVICHSGADTAAATTERAPAQQSPVKACDHCTLCNAAPAASGPHSVMAAQLAPPSVLQVLAPNSHVVLSRPATAQHPVRGPPRLT